MADARRIPPIFEQIILLALVRWQVFRNSLRRKQKQAELVFKILFWLSSLSTVVFGGLAFFSATYFLFPQRPAMIIPIMWMLFITWQVIPLVLEGQSPALDFREIARYPIRFPLFFFLSIAYGMLDPAAVIASVWAACVWAAVAIASPHHLWPLTLAFALFLPMNLFMSRAVFGSVARIAQTRGGRERLMAFTLLSIVAMQFGFWLLPAQIESHRGLLNAALTIGKWLPPGWAAGIAIGTPQVRLRAIVLTTLAAVLCASFFYRLCRSNYSGETAGEGGRRSGAAQAAPGWKVPFLGTATSAVLEKEVRYILKDPRIFTNLLMVWGFAFVSSFGSGMLRNAFQVDTTNHAGKLYPAIVGYSLLVINMLAFNSFGSDPPGFQRWLLSPLPMRSVMLAKNIAFAGMVAADIIVVTAIFRLRGPIPASVLVKTILGGAYVTLAMVALGNVISVWFPKKIVPGRLSGKNVSEAGVVISLAAMALLSASWAGVTILAARRGNIWLPYVAFAFFFAIAAAMYALSLRIAPKYIASRLDNLLAELT